MVMVSYQQINGMSGNKTFLALNNNCEEWILKNCNSWMSWSIMTLDPPNGITMDAHTIACGRNPRYYPVGQGGQPNNNLHTNRRMSA